MGFWNEFEHPRDEQGRFISKDQALLGGTGYIRAPRMKGAVVGGIKGLTEGAVQGAAAQASKGGYFGGAQGFLGPAPAKGGRTGARVLGLPTSHSSAGGAFRGAALGAGGGIVGGIGSGALEGGVKGGIGGTIHGAWLGHKTARAQRAARIKRGEEKSLPSRVRTAIPRGSKASSRRKSLYPAVAM